MRILYISMQSPCPALTGARQRAFLQLKALREIGETRVIIIGNDPISPDELAQTEALFGKTTVLTPPAFGAHWPWSMGRWAASRLVDRAALALDPRPAQLLPATAQADAAARIAADFRPDVSMTRYFWAGRMLQTWRFGKAVLDLDDFDPQYLRQVAKDPATPAWRRVIVKRRLAQLEPAFHADVRRYAAVTLASDSDLVHAQGLRATVVPNIPYTNQGLGREPLAPDPASKTILVVGTWGYMPNVLGLNRFLAACWPRVRQAVPGATLEIVGMNVRPQEREAWPKIDGVRLTGFVDDLTAAYARAAFCIAPIYQGGGTKIKVLEALSYTRACVSTTHAHYGYESAIPDGHGILVAGSDDRFAQLCIELLNDPARRAAQGSEGHRRVLEHFSYQHVRRQVEACVQGVLRTQASGTSAASAESR